MSDRNDAPVDYDKIRERANAVIRAKAQLERDPMPKHRWHLDATQIDLRNALDRSTVLAILDEREALVERCELAELQAATVKMAMNHAEDAMRFNVDARYRAIRALRRMVDEHISTNKDRDAWRCWSNACDGDHLAPTREAIVHRPDCPVPDAEAVLREAEGAG